MNINKRKCYIMTLILNGFFLFFCAVAVITQATNAPAQKNSKSEVKRFEFPIQENGMWERTPTPVLIASGGEPTATPVPPGTPPNDNQWGWMSALWPRMNRNEVWIRSTTNTTLYNCHRWSFDKTEGPDKLFIDYMSVMHTIATGHGYVECDPSEATLIVMGQNGSSGPPIHTMTKLDGYDDLWESKLGYCGNHCYRIAHKRDALNKTSTVDTYGEPVRYYKKDN